MALFQFIKSLQEAHERDFSHLISKLRAGFRTYELSAQDWEAFEDVELEQARDNLNLLKIEIQQQEDESLQFEEVVDSCGKIEDCIEKELSKRNFHENNNNNNHSNKRKSRSESVNNANKKSRPGREHLEIHPQYKKLFGQENIKILKYFDDDIITFLKTLCSIRLDDKDKVRLANIKSEAYTQWIEKDLIERLNYNNSQIPGIKFFVLKLMEVCLKKDAHDIFNTLWARYHDDFYKKADATTQQYRFKMLSADRHITSGDQTYHMIVDQELEGYLKSYVANPVALK